MNDINALWFHEGKYHMFYQWGKTKRDCGYTSSDDLLHWNDHGLALIGKESQARPHGGKQNVSGEEALLPVDSYAVNWVQRRPVCFVNRTKSENGVYYIFLR